MPYNNFLYLSETERDKSIYRIMSVERVVECLTTKRLTLVKPKRWDDPFENYLLSARVVLANGENGTMDPIRNSVFGLCWTWHRETDAMWRIYSPEKNGVRVKSTPKKLLGALKRANPDFGDVSCFIGEVQYHSNDDLTKSLQKIPLMNTNGSGIADSLLHKRREFSHEAEVRLVYTDNAAGAASDFYTFPIDPNDLFEQAIFDPRMDRTEYLKARQVLLNNGYKNKIGQSVMYHPPPELVINL